MSALSQIPASWRRRLSSVPGAAFDGSNFAAVSAFVEAERAAHEVYPPADDTFAALRHTAPENVRALILGQDPYHGPGQAHGLAFSVRPGVPIPPSLRNIFKERENDLGLSPPPAGDLTLWAERGVLLLNTVLTVRHAAANSHRKRGWESFTDSVIRVVAAGPPTVFVLWGKPAQRKRALLGPEHTVLEAPHPSPLSAYRGFFGSRPFSAINSALLAAHHPPIDWSLPHD